MGFEILLLSSIELTIINSDDYGLVLKIQSLHYPPSIKSTAVAANGRVNFPT